MTTEKKVDLDTLLVEEIGQFGWFQVRTICLAAIGVIFAAFHAEYVFTTARIPTRCLIPECEDPLNTEFSPYWITNAIPQVGNNLDECQRFNVSLSTDPGLITETCPADYFDTNVLVACEEYVYENTNTVVYDFDLACDEWRRSLIGFVRTFGTFAALPVTGYISDRWGRRTALALNAFNTAWIGITRYWADTYLGFTISQIVETIFGSGMFSCTYILVLELVGPKYRVIAGGILSSCFAIGQVFMGLIAWVVPNWRPLTLALYIPQLLTIGYFWVITESVRWYMTTGRYEKSEALLKKVAKVNKKHLSDRSLELLKINAEEDKQRRILEEAEKAKQPWLIVLVFRNKRILLRCIILPVCWITMTLIYYGLSINAVNISGNQYVNFIAVSAAELPGFWIAVFLLNKIGRKPVLITAFWLCATCQFIYTFMAEELPYGASLTVYLVGKCSISAVTTALYVFTAELFPTKYRHNLFAYSSMIGRIGSVTAPLTPAIGAATFDELPFIVFGAFALAAGVSLLFLPETLGTKLPDTLEEAGALEKK